MVPARRFSYRGAVGPSQDLSLAPFSRFHMQPPLFPQAYRSGVACPSCLSVGCTRYASFTHGYSWRTLRVHRVSHILSPQHSYLPHLPHLRL